MNRTSKWWIVGGIAATLLAVACVGTLALGMMFAGPRFGGQMMNRQAPVQIAPQPDDAPRMQPGQPDARGFRGDDRGFYRDSMRGYGGRFNQGRGMGLFGFIGGVFRLFFTIVLIGLALLFLRRFFFGRGGWGWGGPGRWGGPGGPGAHGDVPPWAEEWHRKMHANMDAPAAAPVADAPASSPSTPAVADTPQASPPDAPADGDSKLV